MLTRIYFFSPDGYKPMKDAHLKALTQGSHGWQADGETWVFGVVELPTFVHPQEVADHMASLGIIVLPGLNDTATAIDQKVYAVLAKHGVAQGDRTLAIAQKMGSQHPLLRPHLF